MNPLRLAFLLLLFLTGGLMAGAADAAVDSPGSADTEPPAASQAAGPSAAPGAGPGGGLRRWIPDRFHIGPQIGLLGSRLRSSREYRALLEPTEVRDGAWKSISWGAVLAAHWHPGFSLALAPRREAYGVETRERTVAFPDNPFPHTLKADTRLEYMVWPLLAGMGWRGTRQRFEVAIGGYAASLIDSGIRWIVDGEEYPNRPAVEVVGDHSGWLVSTGYGFRLGQGEFVAALEAQQGFGSLLRGLEGEVRPRAVRAQVAYLWIISPR